MSKPKNGSALKVMAFLLARKDDFYSIQEIRKNTGLCFLTAWRVVRRLDRAGLLISEQKGVKYRAYQLKVK